MSAPETATFAPFFSVRTKSPTVRRYRATWPCGSTWDFDHYDLTAPIYKDGEQTGISIEADTITELLSYLHDEGAKVMRLAA